MSGWIIAGLALDIVGVVGLAYLSLSPSRQKTDHYLYMKQILRGNIGTHIASKQAERQVQRRLWLPAVLVVLLAVGFGLQIVGQLGGSETEPASCRDLLIETDVALHFAAERQCVVDDGVLRYAPSNR